MAEVSDIFKCNVCGHMIEVIHAGSGDLVCCGEKMEKLEEKTADSSTEKHVPVVEKTDKGVKVKVGSVPHPMEEKHFIEWVQVVIGGKSYREFLKPGMPPEAEFCVEGEVTMAREYCNVHGLWEAK